MLQRARSTRAAVLVAGRPAVLAAPARSRQRHAPAGAAPAPAHQLALVRWPARTSRARTAGEDARRGPCSRPRRRGATARRCRAARAPSAARCYCPCWPSFVNLRVRLSRIPASELGGRPNMVILPPSYARHMVCCSRAGLRGLIGRGWARRREAKTTWFCREPSSSVYAYSGVHR